MALYSPAGGGCTANLQGPTYDLDSWHLVAITNNGTFLTMYVDGVSQASTQVGVCEWGGGGCGGVASVGVVVEGGWKRDRGQRERRWRGICV